MPRGSNSVEDAEPTNRTIMGTSPVLSVLPLPVYAMDWATEMEFYVVQTNPDLNIVGLP